MWPTPRAPISATRNRVCRLDPADRQRHPELVVEVADGRDGRAGRLEHLGQQVLGRGLARRTGDRHHPQPAGDRPVDLVAGQSPGRDQRVLDHQARTARTGHRSRGEGRRGAAPRRPWPRSRDRRRARPAGRGTGVPSPTCRESTARPVTAASSSAVRGCRRPHRVRRRRAARPPPAPSPGSSAAALGSARRGARRSSAQTSRMASSSAKGSTRPATSWPRSCPLPSTATMSSGPDADRAVAIASRRCPAVDHGHGPAAALGLGVGARRAPGPGSPPDPRCGGCRR